MLLQRCDKEKELFKKSAPFLHDGHAFQLDMRCKYDLWDPTVTWGGDFKSTAAKTQEAFTRSVINYDYPRGRLFYSKITGAKRDVIIGVSKHYPHKIFPVYLREGCPLWEAGEQRLNELAYQYWSLR